MAVKKGNFVPGTPSTGNVVHKSGNEIVNGQKSFEDIVVMNNLSGFGIKLDSSAPDYGWDDIIGIVVPDPLGASAPALQTYRGGNIRQYAFGSGDESNSQFHIPHNYAPGTDLYFHVHWSHNGTSVSGNMVWGVSSSYSKGHNQADYTAEKNTNITYNTVDIATTPQYRHRVDEIQISVSGGSATLIDTDTIEVDGVVLINTKATTIPTIAGGSPNRPFVHFIDIHYQTTNIPTKNKAPNFYT